MLRFLLYFVFGVVYLLITFFGIGPVMFADGSSTERIITLLIVIAIYVIVTLLFRWLLKRIP